MAAHMKRIQPARIDLREAILEIVETEREVSLTALIGHLKEQGHDDRIAIKATLWRLISEGLVDLTFQNKFQPHQEGDTTPRDPEPSQSRAAIAS